MKELIGINVRIVLNDSSGFVTISGKVVNVFDRFILLDTSLGPLYVSFYSIKTIRVMGEDDEKK
jgi:RNase P/RNase MRP subunit p29